MLPNFQSGEFLQSFKEEFSIKPICLNENQKYVIEDVEFSMYFEKPEYAEHAVAIIDTPKLIFVNGNDSEISKHYSNIKHF